MINNATQQIQKLLEERKNLLIVFPKHVTGDAVASALALALFLEKQNKKIDIVCDFFQLPHTLKFLAQTDKIQSKFSNLQKFTISVDVQKTGVQELSYDLKDNKLNIHVTTKQGLLTHNELKTSQSDFKYDAIFTVNTPDLESLGGIYSNNTNLFFKTPIINIDHQITNEHFGQINIVDSTKSSTAEILFEILNHIKEENIDETIATALLTGIISQTKSFKTDAIKPHTLATAGKLISMGADREKIINNLYRTRTIPMLKLWGVALIHMQNDKNLKLVWSTITREDFVRCGAKETDLKDIIDELINNSPEAKIILLLHEHFDNQQTVIHGLLHTNQNYDAKHLLVEYNPTGTKNEVSFIVTGKNLKQTEEETIQLLKERLH